MTKENDFLKNWHLKLAIIGALVMPAITATGAFYDLKAKMQEKDAAVSAKISALELSSTKEFADKNTLKEVQEDVKRMRDDVTEIKTLLIKRSR